MYFYWKVFKGQWLFADNEELVQNEWCLFEKNNKTDFNIEKTWHILMTVIDNVNRKVWILFILVWYKWVSIFPYWWIEDFAMCNLLLLLFYYYHFLSGKNGVETMHWL